MAFSSPICSGHRSSLRRQASAVSRCARSLSAIESVEQEIRNPKSQTNSKTSNSKPPTARSSAVRGHKRRRPAHLTMGEIWGQPRPFRCHGVDRSLTQWFAGLGFRICLGFGISNFFNASHICLVPGQVPLWPPVAFLCDVNWTPRSWQGLPDTFDHPPPRGPFLVQSCIDLRRPNGQSAPKLLNKTPLTEPCPI
jgi:hypothetical protein